MSRPNIIFILVDQMRGDCMSCDGHQVVETPNLDHLAARGARFPHAYTAVPSCIPARSTIMTGMDQWHTGVLGMGRGQGSIPNDFPHTLAGIKFNRLCAQPKLLPASLVHLVDYAREVGKLLLLGLCPLAQSTQFISSFPQCSLLIRA